MPASKKDFGPNDLGKTTRERFLKYVDHGDENECWPWLGAIHPLGYGWFAVKTSLKTYAHRVAVALDGRTIPAGKVVDHTCHNPPCVNPRHLQVVTQWQNLQYRVTRDNTQYRGGGKKRSRNKDYCVNGHKRTEENTYHYTNKRTGREGKYCRACQRDRIRGIYRKFREAREASKEIAVVPDEACEGLR